MGQKRITRAQAQRNMTWIESELRDCDSFASGVQDHVRTVLESTSISPQQEGDMLENEEQITKHYEEISEILMTRAREEAEACIPDEDTIKSAERLVLVKRRELQQLNLDKTDPELNERQWRILANIKARLVEFPALLGQVTGDAAFIQAVKTSYEAKLEGYETKSKGLLYNVFKLPETCSNNVATLLEGFAETTLKPAINIVKLQHEMLETELSKANQNSERLEKLTEELEAEVEKAGAEKRRVEDERQAREESLGQEIAALKKELEDKREVIKDQNEKHKRETTDLRSQHEKARTIAVRQANTFQKELQSSSETVKELRKDKEVLEEHVETWIGRVNACRQDYDDLKAEHRPKEEQLRSAQGQVFSLKEAVVVVEQEKESLRNELTAVKEARNSAEEQIQSLKCQLLTARSENALLTESSERESRLLQDQLSAETIQRKSNQQSYEGQIKAVRSQLTTARTDIDSLKQSKARQLQRFQSEISRAEAEKESLQESHVGELRAVQKQRLDALIAMRELKESNAREIQRLQDELSTEKAEREALIETKKTESQALQSQLLTAKKDIESLNQSADSQVKSLQSEISAEKAEQESLSRQWNATFQSLQSQLTSAEMEIASLKQTSEDASESFQSQISSMNSDKALLESELSSVKSDKESLKHSLKTEAQSFHSQLSSAKSDKESLKCSLEKEMQLLRDQLSTANDTEKSLVKSKQDLETRYCRATESSETKSQLLGLHISILDNYTLEGSESEDVFSEMGVLFGMTEQYTGSTTETVSMPTYMPALTLVGKATELPEPNLATARRLWISSRCGSLDLVVAQAFFMQQEISSAQFALLPWIHAALSHAAIRICGMSDLTPDLASSLVWILQGLLYTATVAREWPEDRVWGPKIEEVLTQTTNWLRGHVLNEASLLMMIVGQVNEIVITHKSPSTSISPSLVPESRRIDSTNSDIPEGMAMVVDISGIIILFTADNAFVFGASEVKAMEVDFYGSILIQFDQAVLGLPATLTEVRLLNRDSPTDVYNRHCELLEPVLTEDCVVVVYPFKRQRTR